MTPNERRARRLTHMFEQWGRDQPLGSAEYEYTHEAIQHAIHLLQQEELTND